MKARSLRLMLRTLRLTKEVETPNTITLWMLWMDAYTANDRFGSVQCLVLRYKTRQLNTDYDLLGIASLLSSSLCSFGII